MRIESGKYIAETAEEMQELMQMALQGGPRSPQLSRNTNISALETLGILGATYPGSNDLLGIDDVNLGSSQGYSTGRNPHYYSKIEGPSSQAAGYGSRASRPFKGGGAKPDVPGPTTRLRNTVGTLGGATEAALGLGEVAKSRSAAIGKGVKGATKAMGFAPTVAGRNGRIAMQALKHPALQAGLKWAGPVGAALAAGDLILGQESLANKGMDAANGSRWCYWLCRTCCRYCVGCSRGQDGQRRPAVCVWWR